MKNPKNKGNTFERKIANLLSERFKEWTGLDKSFRRNADSGSYFGGINESRLRTHGTEKANLGDIICPDDFQFTIECKHYKTPPGINALLSQSITEWDNWIAQAQQDSKNSGKNFLLIIRYNRVNEFVITNLEINTNIKYKGFSILQLSELLNNSDQVFFEKK